MKTLKCAAVVVLLGTGGAAAAQGVMPENAFDKWDADADGAISPDEFQYGARAGWIESLPPEQRNSPEDIRRLFRTWDRNGDGAIDGSEWVELGRYDWFDI